MARLPAPGSVIVPDWHESAEGKEYLACILRKNRRRVFGLLERPVLSPPVAIDTARYKIFVSGKSGVGKTALVAKLAGLEVPVVHHETTGIQTTVVFWPAKLQASDRVVMFRFEFWDCGESALKKFDHMLPEPEAGVNGLRMLPGRGDLCPGTSRSLLWAAVSRSVKGRMVLRLLRALQPIGSGYKPRMSRSSASIPRLARRKQMLSSSSSPSLTGPPLKTSLDSWPE
ncbi:ciliogenesis and planar polarity effector 2 isoform X2 [Delphinus delphis]|uniref:Ciliogenesis and planar polarity effector 2 isoform X3 n=1 Tax=Tursiops truncatus TaxID=9739 RepID=A0A6J3Q8V9_TURTR|nr:ciliogenesis and planar polarity effector 2 isoform X3 [Tursiops truncatus]XP_059889939.1 ciliogenesis and planar polarity effector 2 isoform X2 [Delphinus delphis]